MLACAALSTLSRRTANCPIIGAWDGNVLAWFVPLLVLSCASASPRPDLPSFEGVETEQWLVQETAPINRDDILPAFEASAHNYGCRTEQLGRDSSSTISGELRSFYGVSASCDDGAIALITLVGGRVRIGCLKPTTRERCDALLRNISQYR